MFKRENLRTSIPQLAEFVLLIGTIMLMAVVLTPLI